MSKALQRLAVHDDVAALASLFLQVVGYLFAKAERLSW
jgi:hypothetical protein